MHGVMHGESSIRTIAALPPCTACHQFRGYFQRPYIYFGSSAETGGGGGGGSGGAPGENSIFSRYFHRPVELYLPEHILDLY